MAYEPKLRCLRPEDAPAPETTGGSHIREKPVRVVRSGAEHILDLPLSRFSVEGQPLQAQVPWWHETIWFVPGASDAEALVAAGVARGRIWTVGELQQVADLDSMTDDQLRNVAQIKAMFGCTVLDVGPDRPAGDGKPTSPPRAAGSAWLPFRGDRA